VLAIKGRTRNGRKQEGEDGRGGRDLASKHKNPTPPMRLPIKVPPSNNTCYVGLREESET
jgi:hypothetical protein